MMEPTSTARRRGNGASAGLPQALEPWRERWQAMQPRERLALGLALLVITVALLWGLGIRPAWQVVRQAPERLSALDAELQDMRRLAVEARGLRAAPQVGAGQAQSALRDASTRLGQGQRLTIQGDRAVLNVDAVEVEALVSWMSEIRSGARARIVEAQLTRDGGRYSGTITLSMGMEP
jgi:general secretion pathway protein M